DGIRDRNVTGVQTCALPISPAAHFQMGGVKVSVDCESEISGLFVAGEDAGGVHGSNRLGGNGVCDSTVFGARAGDAAAIYVEGLHKTPQISEEKVNSIVNELTEPFYKDNGENPFYIRQDLKKLMWNKVGLVRNSEDLKSAEIEIAKLKERTNQVSISGSRKYN